jgi:hypothetical protein
LTVPTPSDLEIVLTREFDAARELVSEAMSRPEQLVGQADSTLLQMVWSARRDRSPPGRERPCSRLERL